MKIFFNFSYKRYRFYFGIFLPCNFTEAHKFNPEQHRICLTPCPIIISEDRHACGVHLSQAFKDIVVYSNKEKDGDTNADFVNNKASHAISFIADEHQDRKRTSFQIDWVYLIVKHFTLRTQPP
ncbi:unnamed protein product [Rhizophagus irregularis]|nr:unnamed protein product [Rhizophagus irregularis]